MDAALQFRYVSPAVRVFAGRAALAQLPREVGRLGAGRVMAVCAPGVARQQTLLKRIESLLGGALVAVFDGVRKESPLWAVEAGVGLAREANPDVILAVGGGSTVVTARAITILLAQGRPAHELATQYPPGQPPVSPRLGRPKLPNLVVPTTPNTAVNRAGAAVLDPETRRRLELFDPKTRPAAVFLDAEALLGPPPEVSVRAAVAAFAGAVAAFTSRPLNPFAFADLRTALELLKNAIPAILAGPAEAGPRLAAACAALLSNRAADALGGDGGGVVSALVHQTQSRYDHIDQGTASAALLVPGLRFNRPVTLEAQLRLASILGAEPSAEGLDGWIDGFLGRLGFPRRLRELGIPEGDLPALAEAALHDFFLQGNPRQVEGPAELLELLRAAW